MLIRRNKINADLCGLDYIKFKTKYNRKSTVNELVFKFRKD